MLYVRYVHLTSPSMFIRDKPILSSEGMLQRTMAARVQLKKKNSRHEPQRAWRQDELIDGKPPVVK
jgi:hypothetical protein